MLTVTGSYGFVLFPNSEIARRAVVLGKEARAKFGVVPSFRTSLPHITLHHLILKGATLELVDKLLSGLAALQGELLSLVAIREYGGKFLFWDICPSPLLELGHQAALRLSRYRDRDSTSRAAQERLELTNGQRRNLKLYGHPLSHTTFRPHITLAYCESGFDEGCYADAGQATGTIDRIAFAEIGNYGAIKRIIVSTPG
jgi:2'-5' RNA ligase